MDFQALPGGVRGVILDHAIGNESNHVEALQTGQNTLQARLEDTRRQKAELEEFIQLQQQAFPDFELLSEDREFGRSLDEHISELQAQITENNENQSRPRAALRWLNMYQRTRLLF